MPAFKFRLARVLDWYRKLSRLEEDRLRVIVDNLARAEEAIVQLRESRKIVERGVVDADFVQATDLAALDRYREHSRRGEMELERTRVRVEGLVVERRALVKALRVRIRLLEKLGERRLAEHVSAEGHALEELAADAFRAASFRSGTQPPES
jgi:hypothetical protein